MMEIDDDEITCITDSYSLHKNSELRKNPELIGNSCAGAESIFENVSTYLADAPLSNILPTELEHVDPQTYFPDFQKNEILRFTRLFSSIAKPTIRNQIWWTSRTFRRDAADADKNESESVLDAENEEDYSINHELKDRSKWIKIGLPPEKECCQRDDYELLCSLNPEELINAKKVELNEDDEESAPPWRYGPAQVWYDKLNVPPNPANFDYGFKLKKESRFVNDIQNQKQEIPDINDPAYLPVNLMNWEDDIILDNDLAREKLIRDYSSGSLPKCGWIPTPHTRTYQSFLNAWNNGTFIKMLTQPGQRPPTSQDSPEQMKAVVDSHNSLFPYDNYELEHTRWEDNIIWDATAMPAIPKPTVLTIDYEDDPKIFGIPEEDTPLDKSYDDSNKSFDRKNGQYTRRSKMILSQVAKRQRQEEEEQMETTIAQIADKDPFNLSNDDYYRAKDSQRQSNSLVNINSIIQHSLPAQSIHPALFSYHWSIYKLRHFHRMPVPKRFLLKLSGRQTPIFSLTRHIKKSNDQRFRNCDNELFVLRDIKDLTGRDGTLLMVEYSEQYPPFLNQPGMASKIRNYYSRKVAKESEIEPEFGERAFAQMSPFLGTLPSDQYLQAIENKLYRAPVYRHKPNTTDFLLIRTKLGWFIRPISNFFIAGQESPVDVVPSPNSKQANTFVNNFLLAYAYRLFWENDDKPRKIRLEDIRSVFPPSVYPESVLKKRLKHCAEFKKIGSEQTYLIKRDEFALPSKEEILAMITPESYCANMSMLSAQQRLKDAGYGEKYFFTPENDEDLEDQPFMEDEIKCAPWNTTKAFIDSQNGKCLLDQTGVGDPTGCGQGFSYVRLSAKPQKSNKEDLSASKKLVTGTSADLRKLPLKDAKEICRQYGLLDDEINSLTRWEIIDVIRNLSTQAAKSRSAEFAGMVRFARGNIRFNFADMQEKYKDYCQKIFDLQNSVLSSSEHPTDALEDRILDGTTADKYPTFSSISTLTEAKKRQLEFELEERERLDLQRMIHGEVTKSGSTISKGAKEAVAANIEELSSTTDEFSIPDPKSNIILNAPTKRSLKIYRTIKDVDGNENIQMEIITHPQLIEAYMRIRSTRNDEFIKVYAQQDDQYKEEKKKEKRRLQEQMRRKKNDEKRQKSAAKEQEKTKEKEQSTPADLTVSPNKIARKSKKKTEEHEEKKQPSPKPSPLKVRCSACGEVGHMKTNRNCPLYGKENADDGSNEDLSGKTVREICQKVDDLTPHDQLVQMETEGIRMKISKQKLFKHAERMKRNALRLHIPKRVLNRPIGGGAKTPKTPKPKTPKRLMKKMTQEQELEDPATKVQQEILVIDDEKPSTSRTNAPEQASTAAVSSLGTTLANKHRRGTIDEPIFGPQKSVHRRRADPRISMATTFHDVFSDFKSVEGSEDLMHPVNAKKVPDYYDIIQKPMDLSQIRKNISENKYELRRQFLEDLTQILANSITYNGKAHRITEAAQKVLDIATQRLQENESKLISLEKAINPLLDDNDMVGFSHILMRIVQECKNLPKSVAFHTKVDLKKLPNYCEKVSSPMDLGTIEQNIKDHKYTNLASFKRDIQQIYINSELFNGPNSQYTEKALEIVNLSNRLLEESYETLAELESNIQKTLCENADIDDNASIVSGYSATSVMPEKIGIEYKLGDAETETRSIEQIMEMQLDLPTFYLGDIDDEMTAQVSEPAPSSVLQEDLALSNDEMDDEVTNENASKWDTTANLMQSQMFNSGQLRSDLALSSDDSDTDLQEAKRPKLDDFTSFL